MSSRWSAGEPGRGASWGAGLVFCSALGVMAVPLVSLVPAIAGAPSQAVATMSVSSFFMTALSPEILIRGLGLARELFFT
jgi:hypothetical protein